MVDDKTKANDGVMGSTSQIKGGLTYVGADSSESIQSALTQEATERENARKEKQDRDLVMAAKLDDKAAKIRSRVAAQERLAEKQKVRTALQEETDSKAAADKKAALDERNSVAPSRVKAYADDMENMGARALDEIDMLERVVLTLCNILLSINLTPAQRGKVANCIKLITDPPIEG